MKKNYVAPTVELVEFRVEQGFAVSEVFPPQMSVSRYNEGHHM